jgi:hypothetical protein
MSQLIETLVRFYTISSLPAEAQVVGIEEKLLELQSGDHGKFPYLP